MSPVTPLISSTEMGFPRVSGDEPVAGPHLRDTDWFSPRERG